MRLPRFATNPLLVLGLLIGLGALLSTPARGVLETGTAVGSRRIETTRGELPLFGAGITVLNFGR